MSMSDDAWDWLRKAPLPVVLALVLPAGVFLTVKQVALATEQTKQAVEIKSVEKEQEDTKQQVKEANEKLDKLLEAVLRLQALAELEAKQKDEKDRPKGGKKP